MQNSAVKTRLQQKVKESPGKMDASEAGKNAGTSSGILRGPPRSTVKGLIRKSSRNSSPMPGKRSSSTSMASHQAAPVAASARQRLKNKFTQPRMNQLTHQRINRLRCTTTGESVSAGQDKNSSSKKLSKSSSQHSIMSNAASCELQLDVLHNKLKQLQSAFLRKLSSCKQQNYAVKMITIIHNNDCHFVVNDEDLHALPTHIPVSTVNDLKNRCRLIFESGAMILYDQLSAIPEAPNAATANGIREELRLKIEDELSSKIEIMINEIDQMCSTADKSETGSLLRQIAGFDATTQDMRCTIEKLSSEMIDLQVSRDDYAIKADELKGKNHDLASELCQKNILCIEQKDRIDELLDEIDLSNTTIRDLQQQVNEKNDAIKQLESCLEAKDKLNEEQGIQLDHTKAEKDFLTRRSEELSEVQDERNLLIDKLQQKLQDFEKRNELQHLQVERVTQNEADLEKLNALQNELENQKCQIERRTQVEQQLRMEIEEKIDLLRKADLKLSRLEEQEEHNRQMLVVRGDRIKHLDQEMKQREWECKRKVNEVLCTASAKNTTITQMTNQLAAKNEQFDNLCANLSIKQSKLHSQEHVIKLLEESNSRSVRLHTKLGERNSILKDELEHLRRTVRIYVKILIGNNGHNVFEPVPANEVFRLLTKSKE